MRTTRVLFIGNSYTYCNNLPRMFRDLSRGAAKDVKTGAVTKGGMTLEWHWFNNETLEAIDRGGWDYVVLQDHSQRGVEDPDKLRGAAARLAERARRVNAEPVLYMTWARQHIPEMQDAVCSAYLTAGKQIDAKVAPVGLAWRQALATIPGIKLHVEDKSHPGILGTYLAACVFFGTIFNQTPVGLPAKYPLSEHVTARIDREVAAALQEAAWAGIREIA